ncbi:hypothetical protein MCM47_40355, partial [Kitasatospora sp. A2-31]|nr:hypothetical protein [Kitasatospora sp. A2-31]MCG6500392.1 hypothetical protein [Kitasatospora sp. A2-31]MCG6500394.1 hypothetical protein [Kitasatospora sp. A2-31]
MSDLPFGFGVPPEEPEDGKAKPEDAKGGPGDEQKKEQGGPQPFGFAGGNPFGALFGMGMPGGPGTPGAPGGADNPFAAMFGGLNPNDLGAAFQQ